MVNAYLNNYANANSSVVNSGKSSQQNAQNTGSSIMNSTDKTLPSMTDYTAKVYSGIVKAADRDQQQEIDNLKLAKKAIEEQQKAAEAAAKAAAKASKKSTGSSKSSSKSSGKVNAQSTGTESAETTNAAQSATANKIKSREQLANEKKAGVSATATESKTGSKAASKATGNAAWNTIQPDLSIRAGIADAKSKKEAESTAAKGRTATENYKSGNITADEYTGQASKSTDKTAKTIDEATKQYRNGEITESEYQSFIETLSSEKKAEGRAAIAGKDETKTEEKSESETAAEKKKAKRETAQEQKVKDATEQYKSGKLTETEYQNRIEELASEAKAENKDDGGQSVLSRVGNLLGGTAKKIGGNILNALTMTSGGDEENKRAQWEMRQAMDNGTVFTQDGDISGDYEQALQTFEDTKDNQSVLGEQNLAGWNLTKEGQAQVAKGREGLEGLAATAYDAGSMAANVIPAMTSSAIPVLGPLAYTAANRAGEQVQSLSEQGISNKDAALRSAISGGIEGATNLVPLGDFANIVSDGGGTILQNVAKEAVENAGQEAASYLLNTAADYAMGMPDANFSLQDMAAQVGTGAATGALFGGVSTALNRLGGALSDSAARQAADAAADSANNVDAVTYAQQYAQDMAARNAAQETSRAQALLDAYRDAATSVQADIANTTPDMAQSFAANANNVPALERVTDAQQNADVQQPGSILQADTEPTAANVPQASSAAIDNEIPVNVEVPETTRLGSSGKAYLPDNTEVYYKWAVVNANDLQASNNAMGAPNPDYPTEFQARNRDSASSILQIAKMSNTLNPERLMESANVGDGSPVIRGDNVVLSGNGRTAAIQNAYESGKAENYKAYIQQNASRFGLDANNMPENPVLVRVVDDATDFSKLAKDANESSTASFGASEAARAYSNDAINSNALLEINPSKALNSAENKNAIGKILSDCVPVSEMNRMLDADGNITTTGLRTVKETMFAAAYGENNRLELLAESDGGDSSKNITNAMRDTAVTAALVKRKIADGEIPQEFDVTVAISGAADLYADLKNGTLRNVYQEQASNITEYIKGLTKGADGKYYSGMEECPYNEQQLAVALQLEDGKGSARRLSSYLNALFESAMLGDQSEPMLGGEVNARTAQDVFDDAASNYAAGLERAGKDQQARNARTVSETTRELLGPDWANTAGSNRKDIPQIESGRGETNTGGFLNGQTDAGSDSPYVLQQNSGQSSQTDLAQTPQLNSLADAAKTGDSAALGSETIPSLARETGNAQRPLNGSESVPENAVGAMSTKYDRGEVLNRDKAVQRTMRGELDAEEAAAAGIGQQTHTVYSKAEGKDSAEQDFNLALQQGDGSITSAANIMIGDLQKRFDAGEYDAGDRYRSAYTAKQIQNTMLYYDANSAEYKLAQAQLQNLNRLDSAAASKAGQTLSAGRFAQPDEYTAITKFNQIVSNTVNEFGDTREGRQLKSFADEITSSGFADDMDAEFSAWINEGNVKDSARAQMDLIASKIKLAAVEKGIKDVSDDMAQAGAASYMAGGTADDVFNAMARKSMDLADLSQEDYDYAVEAFSRIATMKDSKERYELEESVYARLAQYLPEKTFGEKMNSIRYLAMLGNTRTHIKNIMGNVSMNVVVRAKDNVSGVMQLALPQEQRTKAIGTSLSSTGRELIQGAKDYIDTDVYSLLYNDGKFNVSSGLEGARATFGDSAIGKTLQKVSDVNSNALEKEDAIFLKAAFSNSLASRLLAQGYDASIYKAEDDASNEALMRAVSGALQDAKEATFHEDNFISNGLKGLVQHNAANGTKGKIANALIEGALPFKKTPVNVLKDAVEYSPVSLAGAAIDAVDGKKTATDIIDEAAKGLTGTAAIGIGYILAKNGLLTGSGSGDDTEDAYNEMLGEQDYAVKIDGVGTYTLDWASPAAVPLLIGAEIATSDLSDGISMGDALSAISKISEPVLETTMLQGLNDTLDSIKYGSGNNSLEQIVTSLAGSYASQYVPTVLGQVARTVDDTRRSTYGGGDDATERNLTYSATKMENKVPFLSKTNEAYIDQWGREESQLDGTDSSVGGTILRGLYNTMSPGYYSAEKVTDVDRYLQGLAEETGTTSVYPTKASSKIGSYYMTPKEKTTYAKVSGQTAYNSIDSLRQNESFTSLPSDQQADIISSVYSVAKTAGAVEASAENATGTNSKAYKAYEQGGVDGLIDYLLASNAVSTAKAEKNGDSGENKDLTVSERWNTLSGTFDEETAIAQYVLQKSDSVVSDIYNEAGTSAAASYLNAYSSAVDSTGNASPSDSAVQKQLLRQGLSDKDFSDVYLNAYADDEKAQAAYNAGGASGLKNWVQYKQTADADGNGSITQSEARAALDKMGISDTLKQLYWKNTNKGWKQSY